MHDLVNWLGVIIDGPDTVIYFPGQEPVELSCNVTSGILLWSVNGTVLTIFQLRNGFVPGHSANESNIVIIVPVNNTEYVCESTTMEETIRSDPVFIYIAGGYIGRVNELLHEQYN